MKKIVAMMVLCAGLMSFQQAEAQRLKVNTNQSQQPAWGLKGYDYVSYYYLPDMNAYYYVPDKQFIYQENGAWKFSSQLPAAYRNNDLGRTRKVVINEPKPYANHQYYVSKYGMANRSETMVSVRNARSDTWSANRRQATRTENLKLEDKRREYRRDEYRIKKPQRHPDRGNAYGHL